MRGFLIAIAVFLMLHVPASQAEAACELEPLTLPLFDATPVAAFATPYATPAVTDLSEEDATALLEMYAACMNTGDPALVWAMFSPYWFARQFGDPTVHYLPAFEAQIGSGVVIGTDPLQLTEIVSIEPAQNGRVAVTATYSMLRQHWTDKLILVNIDGQWLIDDVILVDPPAQS